MRRVLAGLLLPASLLLLLFFAPAPAAGEGIRPDFFAPGGPLDREAPAVAAAEPEGREGWAAAGETGLPLLGRTAAGFGIVGLIGYVLYRIVLRLRGGGFVARQIFRPLAVQAIAPGAFLQVVEIGNKAVVLAVSEKSVVPVTEIDDPEELASLRFTLSQTASGGSFRQAITAAWKKTRGETSLPQDEAEGPETAVSENGRVGEGAPAGESAESIRLLLGRLRAERKRLEEMGTGG